MSLLHPVTLVVPGTISGAGFHSMDAAYNGGSSVTVDAGAVIFDNTVADASNTLELIKSPVSGSFGGSALDIVMGVNASGPAINVANSGSGSAISIALDTSLAAQGIVIAEDAVARTTVMMSLSRDAAVVSTGAHVLSIDNNGAGTSISIAHAGQGDAIVIVLDGAAASEGINISETAVARTTPFIDMTRDAAVVSATAYSMLIDHNATTSNAVQINQGGGGDAINIAIDGAATTGQALVVTEDAVARTTPMMELTRQALATGDILRMVASGSGNLLIGVHTGTGNSIDLNHASSGDAINVALTTDLAAQAIVVTEDNVIRTTPMMELTRQPLAAGPALLITGDAGAQGAILGAQLVIKDTSAFAIGGGGKIALHGTYTGTTTTAGAMIATEKSNAVDVEWGFDCVIYSRADQSSDVQEAVRFNESKNQINAGSITIPANSVINLAVDNNEAIWGDGGQVLIKTSGTTAATWSSAQNLTLAGSCAIPANDFYYMAIDGNESIRGDGAQVIIETSNVDAVRWDASQDQINAGHIAIDGVNSKGLKLSLDNNENIRSDGSTVLLDASGITIQTWHPFGSTITQGPVSTGSPTLLTLTAGAHTTLTASAEAVDIDFDLARTVHFATGNITKQSAFLVQPPTYAFVGASTITYAAAMEISGPPVAGTFATITHPINLILRNDNAGTDDGALLLLNATTGLVVENSPAIQWRAHNDLDEEVLAEMLVRGKTNGSETWPLDQNLLVIGGQIDAAGWDDLYLFDLDGGGIFPGTATSGGANLGAPQSRWGAVYAAQVNILAASPNDALIIDLDTNVGNQAIVVTEDNVIRTASMMALTRQANATGIVLDINNDGAGQGIRVLQGGAGTGVEVYLNGTSTAPYGINVWETSGVARTTPMMALTRDAAVIAAGAHVISIDNNGGGNSINIAHAGDSNALAIILNGAGFLSEAINISESAVARTTPMVDLTRDGAVVDPAAHVVLIDNSATLNNALHIIQTGGGNAINIAIDGAALTGQALVVTETAVIRSTAMMQMTRASVATGVMVQLANAGSGTALALAQSGAGDAINIALSTSLVNHGIAITEDNVVRTQAMLDLRRQANATGMCIYLDNNGLGHAIDINQGGAGHGLDIYLDGASTTGQAFVVTETAVARTTPMMQLTRNAAASGVVLDITNPGSGYSIHVWSGNSKFEGDLTVTGDILGLTWSDWAPTFGGFSSDPTVVASYAQIGKTVTARMFALAGTSNATTFTVTLPVAAKSASLQGFAIGPVEDNGTVQSTPGLLLTRSGSATADVYLDMASTSWTASGSKKADFVITYEAA